MNRRGFKVAAAITLVATAKVAAADVRLTTEERENLGIRSQVAIQAEVPRSWRGSAQVLDANALLALLGDLHAAEVAYAGSDSEARRSERLNADDSNVSLRAVDAARSQAALDAARLESARAQLKRNWGPAVSGMTPVQRKSLIQDLGSGRTSLARVDMLDRVPEGLKAPHIELRSLDGVEIWEGRWLGVLPQTQPLTLSGSALVQLLAPVQAGHVLLVSVRERQHTRKGWTLPPSAVVNWRGAQWYYVEETPGRFTRRELVDVVPDAGNFYVPAGTAPIPRIVTVGARSLLAAEFALDSRESRDREP